MFPLLTRPSITTWKLILDAVPNSAPRPSRFSKDTIVVGLWVGQPQISVFRMTTLKVGGATVELDEAKAWARTYLVGRPRTSAYPAYDGYPGSLGDSVGPQDLLAVALLNVSNNPLPVYYGLESLVAPMNERLEDPALDGDLASASDETLEAIVRLFGVLETLRQDTSGSPRSRKSCTGSARTSFHCSTTTLLLL